MRRAHIIAGALLCLPGPLATARQHSDAMHMPDMEMDGGHFAKLQVEKLEWRGQGESEWNAHAWYGGDYDKLLLRTEGSRSGGHTDDAGVEGLWDRIVSPWWNLQVGARLDLGEGPHRGWLAVGLTGLAPQWVGVEATAYLGEQGRSAMRLRLTYDVQLSQRLLLQPELEINAYGKSDPARGVRSGLSDVETGLRLRYEIRRRFAPYVGVSYARHRGAGETRALAGLRIWF